MEQIKQKKDWATVAWLILFFPVGLYKMWRSNQFPLAAKLVITSFFALIIYASLNQDSQAQNKISSTKVESTTDQAMPLSKEEISERKADEMGEAIRKKYKNGVFTSSLVDQNKNVFTFKLSVNESQWAAMNNRQKHQLVTFVLNDFRMEFCKNPEKICKVELEGLYQRRLASSSEDRKIALHGK